MRWAAAARGEQKGGHECSQDRAERASCAAQASANTLTSAHEKGQGEAGAILRVATRLTIEA